MTNERYKIIKLTEHKEWLEGSPIKIEKSQLLLDSQNNKIILQLKLFNLNEKVIKAVFLDIDCFDAANDFLTSLNDIVIQGLEAKPHSSFADRQPITLENSNTANVRITIAKVVFVDDNVWRNEEKNTGVVLPEQKIIDQNDPLYGQIIRECSEKNIMPVFWFESEDVYWRCTCGQPNKVNLLRCGYCQTEKEWLRQHFDKQYLKEANARFLESEAIRIIEVKKQQEELGNKAKAKKKKQKIVTLITVLVCLIIAVSLVIINTPSARAERQYNLGNKYLQDGKYQEAVSAFEKVIQIDPKNIPAREELFNVYIKENELDDANNILQEISKIDPKKDVKQFDSELDSAKAISASKASYDQGIQQMNNKQFPDAIASFQKVIKEDQERYNDAQKKINDCKKAFIDTTLQKAKDAASNKDYQTALDSIDQGLKVDPNNQEALKLKSDFANLFEQEKVEETAKEEKKEEAKAVANTTIDSKQALNILENYTKNSDWNVTDGTLDKKFLVNGTSQYTDGHSCCFFCGIGGNAILYVVDKVDGSLYESVKNIINGEFVYYLTKLN